MTDASTYYGIILIFLAIVIYFYLRRFSIGEVQEPPSKKKTSPFSWLSPFSTNPWRRKRIKQLKTKHRKNVLEKEQNFLYKEFGGEPPKKLHPLFFKLNHITKIYKLQNWQTLNKPGNWLEALESKVKKDKNSAFNVDKISRKEKNKETIEQLREIKVKNK